MANMAEVTVKELLEAGVHFGHQTKRWNPKMKKYIFGERNGIYIIDLQKTVEKFRIAYDFIRRTAAQGQAILFVGTKRQAQDIIAEEAKRCGAFYVTHRWLGGMLTNFLTIRKSVEKLKAIEAASQDGTFERLPKKEVIRLEKERERLSKNLEGIREMTDLPGAIYVVDVGMEETAVLEAKRLMIPSVAIVDTNCDPDHITHPIPGNDDAFRAIKLITSRIADAVIEGRRLRQPEIQPAAPEEPAIRERVAQATEAEGEGA